MKWDGGGRSSPAELEPLMTRLNKSIPQVLYPEPYVWLVFLAAMDIMMTTVVLVAGGREVNGLADWVIGRFDLMGLILFKFTILLLFVGICEILGRRSLVAGKRLAAAGIAINLLPVAVAFMLLYRLIFTPS
jgi:hypothetical protein